MVYLLLPDAVIRLLEHIPLHVVVKILEHKMTQAHFFLDKCHHAVVYCRYGQKERATAQAQITNQGSDNQPSIDQGAAHKAEKVGEG